MSRLQLNMHISKHSYCLAMQGRRNWGGGGAGGAAAPVAFYQEGQGGKGALSI